MKLTLRKLVNAVEALQVIGREKMGVKLAYRIERNVGRINVELEAYQKARRALVMKHGQEDPKEPGRFEIPRKNKKAFNDELEILLAEEVDVDIRPIGLEELTFDVAPLHLLALEWMLEVDEGAESKPERQRHPRP
jgi:hypothetical protein